LYYIERSGTLPHPYGTLENTVEVDRDERRTFGTVGAPAEERAPWIRRATFENVRAPETAIEGYLSHQNEHCTLFVWTANADAILDKVGRFYERTSETQHQLFGESRLNYVAAATSRRLTNYGSIEMRIHRSGVACIMHAAADALRQGHKNETRKYVSVDVFHLIVVHVP
jgi:hypothetical protein